MLIHEPIEYHLSSPRIHLSSRRHVVCSLVHFGRKVIGNIFVVALEPCAFGVFKVLPNSRVEGKVWKMLIKSSES